MSDFLDKDGGREDLEGGADEVLSGLGVAEADHEPLETRLAVCVAEEHDPLHQAELVEEAPEHHLLLPHVREVHTLQQDLVWDRNLKRREPIKTKTAKGLTRETHAIEIVPVRK